MPPKKWSTQTEAQAHHVNVTEKPKILLSPENYARSPNWKLSVQTKRNLKTYVSILPFGRLFLVKHTYDNKQLARGKF